MSFYGIAHGIQWKFSTIDISDPAGDIGSESQQLGKTGAGDFIWPGQPPQFEAQPQQLD